MTSILIDYSKNTSNADGYQIKGVYNVIIIFSQSIPIV